MWWWATWESYLPRSILCLCNQRDSAAWCHRLWSPEALEGQGTGSLFGGSEYPAGLPQRPMSRHHSQRTSSPIKEAFLERKTSWHAWEQPPPTAPSSTNSLLLFIKVEMIIWECFLPWLTEILPSKLSAFSLGICASVSNNVLNRRAPYEKQFLCFFLERRL